MEFQIGGINGDIMVFPAVGAAQADDWPARAPASTRGARMLPGMLRARSGQESQCARREAMA